MKISVFTVMAPDCNPDRIVELLQENGYDGVEWRFAKKDPKFSNETPSFWRNNYATVDEDSTEEELLALKRKTDAAGLAVPNLAAYIKVGDTAAVETAMRAAQLLGSPSIRVGVPQYDRSRHYADLFKEARDFLRDTEELSRTYGVKALIEIHHRTIIPSTGHTRQLVEGFDPNRIGVIYDPGNMVHEGFEQYKLGLEVLGEYLAHVHMKNAIWRQNPSNSPLWKAEWAPISKGIVHWPQVLADLNAIGYDGWFSFEDFSAHAPSEALLRDNLAYIRSIM